MKKNMKNRKQIIAGICSVCICFSMSAMPISAEDNTHLDLFVQNGAKSGNGTKDAPFATIEEARDYIRQIKKDGKYPAHGVTVNLRGGNYFISDTIEFTEEDSGTSDGEITYRAYVNEDVTINGGIEINLNKFANISDSEVLKRVPANAKKGIKQYDLFKNGITKEMIGEIYYINTSMNTSIGEKYYGMKAGKNISAYFDGEMLDVARWPNGEYATIEKVIDPGALSAGWNEGKKGTAEYVEEADRVPRGMKISIPSEKAKLWSNVKDIWAYGQWTYTWSYLTTPIKSIDAENAVMETVLDGVSGARKGQPYYVFNLLEELDTPGEYYIDRDSGILYFYPPKSSGTFEMALLQKDIIKLTGTKNLKFKGLRIKNGLSKGIAATDVDNIGVEHCVLTQINTLAIDITGNTYNSYVTGSLLYNLGGTGIFIGGGDMKEMIPDNCYVENCWIHDFGKIYTTYNPGVYLRGVGTRVSHCRINNAPHSAILTATRPNQKIEYCEIYDALQETSDSGAIYTGKTWIGRNLEISNNYIHDIAVGMADGHGVYLDDFYCGGVVKNNIFENILGEKSCAIAGGGRDSQYTDNIFINCYGTYRALASKNGGWWGNGVDSWLVSNGFGLNSVNIEKYAEQFPHFTDYKKDDGKGKLSEEDAAYNMNYKYSVYDRNYKINTKLDPYWNSDGGFATEEERFASIKWETKDYVKAVEGADPGFENIGKKDYRMKKDAEIYKKIPGFEACDFENVGVYTQRLKDKLGDTVSLKIDSPIIYNGFQAMMIDKNNLDVRPVIVGGRTMLPVRVLAEIFGGSADWNEDSRTATLKIGSNEIVLDIANGTITKNGERVESDAAPMVYENRTVAPLRIVGEMMDKNIDWYDGGYDNRLIFISDAKVFDHKSDIMYINEMSRRLGVK